MSIVSSTLQVAAKYDGPIIVQKGLHDAISDGKQTIVCKADGSPRRAGGQVGGPCRIHGDVRTGTLDQLYRSVPGA